MSRSRYQHWIRIGEGAYGTVYLVEDTRLNRLAAIKKVALPALSEKQGATLLQKLHHPACPQLLDQFEETGCCFIVMTYFEGKALTNLKLSSRMARRMILEMLDVMAQMQELNFTYNDFKPANMICNGRHFYLIDFGSALPYQSTLPRFGSKAFASPEYLSGNDIDWRSDLYSLAKTAQSLVQQPDPILHFWLKKALRLSPDQRFKSLSRARWILSFRYGICSLLLGVLIIIFGCGHFIQDTCYQWALEKENWQMCLQIDSTRKEVFESYLSSHDPMSCQTWVVLWQWQIVKVQDEDFLWQCIHQLAQLSDSFAWQLQAEILMNISHQKADMYQKLLAAEYELSFFENWAKEKEDRMYLYRCCICQKKETFPLFASDFRQWAETDKLLSSDEKWQILAQGAMLSLDGDFLKDIYFQLPDTLIYLKAQLACTLFEIGYYQEGWLHQAESLLQKCQNDLKCQSLYESVMKKMKQWGSES